MRIKDQLESNTNPLVSISCISFNQENYIGTCIEGFLNQIVDFPVEILIHDDASTDNTQKIISEYAEKYPHIIKPKLQSENQFSKGAKCIHAIFNFSRSTGEYIATCEGDDFWIDENKLMKQIYFLKNNKDFTLCSHEVFFTSIFHKKNLKSFFSIIYRNVKFSGMGVGLKLFKEFLRGDETFWNKRRSNILRYYEADFEKIISSHYRGTYIPTVSIVARGDVLRALPDDLKDSPSGHREHIVWCALHGRLKHLKDVMGQRNQQANSLTVTKLIKKHGLSKYSGFTMFYNKIYRYVDSDQRIMIDNALMEMSKYFDRDESIKT